MANQCPFCRETQLQKTNKISTDYISKKSFNLTKCYNCGCHLTDTTHLSREDPIYGNIYYNSPKGKFLSLFEFLFSWTHKRNAKQLHKRFFPKKTLEIGCGRAYLLTELKKLGSEVYCLESAEAAEWILQNKDIRITTARSQQTESWPYQANTFDLIIFWHVLEHLEDPVTCIQEAFRTLAEGKHICISAPNISSLQARINIPTWFHLDVPRHHSHFSRQGIISLLETNGFKVTQVRPGDNIQNLFGWFQSLANLLTPNEINSFYRLLQGGQSLKGVSLISLFIQLITSFIWIPLGLLGYCIEKLQRTPGNITVIAKKHTAPKKA